MIERRPSSFFARHNFLKGWVSQPGLPLLLASSTQEFWGRTQMCPGDGGAYSSSKLLERFTQFDGIRCGLLPNKLCPLLWRNLSVFIKRYQILLHEFLIELSLPAPEAFSHSFQCILFGCFLCSQGESDGSLQCCPQELLRLIRHQPPISYSDWDVLLDKESATVAEFGAGLTRCNRLPFNTDLCYCINAKR